jgi:hypothetical protein
VVLACLASGNHFLDCSPRYNFSNRVGDLSHRSWPDALGMEVFRSTRVVEGLTGWAGDRPPAGCGGTRRSWCPFPPESPPSSLWLQLAPPVRSRTRHASCRKSRTLSGPTSTFFMSGSSALGFNWELKVADLAAISIPQKSHFLDYQSR